MRSGADQNGCGSLGPICGSVITVALRLGLGLVLGLGLGFALGFGLGFRIVVYKLLERVTKCGSITWLKLINGVPLRRSAPLRILSCEISFVTILQVATINNFIAL